MVTISIAKALICFQATCYPVLLGKDTKPGTYQMTVMHTQQRGYGGDVLVYDHRGYAWYGIHRTFANSPRRKALYHGTTAEQRRNVTNGCPNVEPHVYAKLKDCCRHLPLVIE